MKKVLLRFYNKSNLGDDLFVKIITERYKNTFSIIQLKNDKFLNQISNLHIYNNRFIHYSFRVVEELFGKFGLWANLLAKKHDLLVYIGGSIFINNGSDITRWRRDRDFYKRLSIPYYIVGSNFGPYEYADFPEIVRDILKDSKDVCFRDQASYERFRDLPSARVATDVAFSLDTSQYNIKEEKIAIMSLIDVARFGEKISRQYDLEIQKITMKLIEQNYRVIYMSFCDREGDLTASETIASKFDQGTRSSMEIFNYDGNLEEALSLIARSEIIIATRFHATILGILFGKKTLPFAYSDKTVNILKDMDFEGPVVDIRDMADFDGSNFDFNSLKVNNIEKQVELAELQFQELDKVLTKRQ